MFQLEGNYPSRNHLAHIVEVSGCMCLLFTVEHFTTGMCEASPLWTFGSSLDQMSHWGRWTPLAVMKPPFSGLSLWYMALPMPSIHWHGFLCLPKKKVDKYAKHGWYGIAMKLYCFWRACSLYFPHCWCHRNGVLPAYQWRWVHVHPQSARRDPQLHHLLVASPSP